jgi:hypothetical protein
MNIIQLTPGAGAMYCGNCLRDNALVAELRHRGHNALMLPLYLPITLDEKDESAGNPVFFGGINVLPSPEEPPVSACTWLPAKSAHLARALEMGLGEDRQNARGRPWPDHPLDAARRAREASVELEILIDWLKRQPPPDVVCLSNALLVGMARRLRSELKVPVVCTLQVKTHSWTPSRAHIVLSAGRPCPSARRKSMPSSRPAIISAN